MKTLREAIRAVLADDALYKRRDLPGDVDDPPSDCGCGGGCDHCHDDDNDLVNPKYALYTMIGDAISIYDDMEADEFEDEEKNDAIMRMAETIRNFRN
jgi:hypothetical protein